MKRFISLLTIIYLSTVPLIGMEQKKQYTPSAECTNFACDECLFTCNSYKHLKPHKKLHTRYKLVFDHLKKHYNTYGSYKTQDGKYICTNPHCTNDPGQFSRFTSFIKHVSSCSKKFFNQIPIAPKPTAIMPSIEGNTQKRKRPTKNFNEDTKPSEKPEVEEPSKKRKTNADEEYIAAQVTSAEDEATDSDTESFDNLEDKDHKFLLEIIALLPNKEAKNEALAIALKHERHSIVKHLLEQDANPNEALILALRDGYNNTIPWLLKNGASYNEAFILAVTNRDQETVDRLENLIDIHEVLVKALLLSKDQDDTINWLSISNWLLQGGANPNKALVIALRDEYPDVTRWLLKNGADYNVAFILAAENGEQKIVNFLINKVNINEALRIALQNSSFVIANWVLENGAFLNLEDCIIHRDTLIMILKNYEESLNSSDTRKSGLLKSFILALVKDNININAQFIEWATVNNFKQTFSLLVRCNVCKARKKDSQKLFSCSTCKQAFYCSRECQLKDWKSHEILCKTKK